MGQHTQKKFIKLQYRQCMHSVRKPPACLVTNVVLKDLDIFANSGICVIYYFNLSVVVSVSSMVIIMTANQFSALNDENVLYVRS